MQASAASMNRAMVAIRPGAAKAYAQKNPEDFAEAEFEKAGLSLPIPIECVEHPGESLLKTWYVGPKAWLSYLMGSSTNLLAGDGDPCRNFRAFWMAFRVAHAHHDVYNSPHLASCLDRTIPLVLHGDEGRTLKRGKCMVMSAQSILGHVPKPASRSVCDCSEMLSGCSSIPPIGIQGDSPDAYAFPPSLHRSLKRQLTTYRGHSYLSRWLLFTVPSWIYSKYPEVLQTMLARLAGDLRSLFHEGFLVGSKRFYAAAVVIKGDMDWHRQTFHLNRSYALVGTVTTGKLCHLCLAGGGGPVAEDYTDVPGWSHTLLVQRPWDAHAAVPALANIPGYPAPEELLEPDPFHVVKFGIGRSIAGGILVYLARKKLFDYEGCESLAFPARLNRAHANFSLWCRAEKRHPECGRSANNS